MAFLGDIGKAIGNVIHGIGKALGSIVDSIVKTIENIIKEIVKAISRLIEGIINFIQEHLGIIIGIASIILAIGTAYYLAFIYIPSFQNFVFSHPTLLKLYWYIAYAKNVIHGAYIGVKLRIINHFNPILMKVSPFFKRITKPFHTGLSYLKNAINFIRYSVLGRIYDKISGIANFLFKIRLIADIYNNVKQGKYVKAFWKVLRVIDEKVTQEIEKQVNAIYADINQLRLEILDILDGIIRDMSIIDNKARYLEDTFKKLYEAFGVRVFGDVAREINRFRRGVIDTVVSELEKTDNWINRRFRVLTDPLTSFIYFASSYEYWLKKEENLARAFAYNPYKREFIGSTPLGNKLTVRIPPEIRRLLER